ncbi:hypothetical protein GOP47_0018829 [Adiantum capillus-veneris]|uniref:TAFII28-like protein domain-containing protein n=1 Tax=Adiantum capillus-veneris TaxID=13818 RepID=A0A9D4ZA06_ADICA|nr:hypothetical protein GOP47_0018829 [Adiantum capillus-veneris]
MKHTTDGGPPYEDDDIDEDEEGDAEDDDEEVPEDNGPLSQQQQRQQGEGEDGEEDDIGEGDDNLEEDTEDHQPVSTKPTNKRKRSDDEDEKGAPPSARGRSMKGKDDDEEDEENLDAEYEKSQAVDKERIQSIMSQFTEEQMSRYECYRRSNFPKANMRRLLQNVAGCPISLPMSIVMSGIAKMFVGELVETGRRTKTISVNDNLCLNR